MNKLFIIFLLQVGNSWTKLLVSINATQVKVWVNCDTLEKAMLDAPIDLKLPNGGEFYFGQEPDFKNPLMVNKILKMD